MIKTVIFDIGNVLVDFCYEECYRSFIKEEAIYEKLVKATIGTNGWNEMDRGVLTDEQIRAEFVKNDPTIEKEIDQLFEHLHLIIKLKDTTISWIEELKSKGFQVLVLSNFPKTVYEICKEDQLRFLEIVDGGILSFRDHVIKPDPAIYKLLMERYELVPEECVFLDDLEKNVETAKLVGMHTIHFTTRENALKELEILGVK